MRRALPWLGVYALLSLLFFGIPILGHFGSRLLAADDIDSSQFTWFIAWWPHAILHGLNPFITHLEFAPDGYNLTWSTSMPVPAVLFAPLTLTAGPVASYNLMGLLSPALCAWTMLLLCLHVTRGRMAPSVVGGFLFGFSPYMAMHLTGGPYLTLVPLLPVAVLLVLKRLEGSLTERRFVGWMALVLVGQAGISTEVLATGTLFAALALIFAFVLMADRRAALLGLLRPLALAFVLAGVVISPYLYYFFFGTHYEPVLPPFSGDLLSPVLPPALMELATAHGGLLNEIKGAQPEDYLGAPLVVLIALFAWRYRRERITWVMVLAVVAAAVATLGGHLLVHQENTKIPMPWDIAYHVPLLKHAIATRLMVFALLPAAVMAALWLARGGGIARWALALLAAAAFVPHFGDSAWHADAADPAFFSSGQYKHYLHPSDRVLTIPIMGRNQRWQANTGFGFTLAAGYSGTKFPDGYTAYPIWLTLVSGHLIPDAEHELRRFLAAKDVRAIVVDPSVPGPWNRLFGTLGIQPLDIGGVRLYRIPRAMFT